MAAREIAVKTYVVKLGAAERAQLETMLSLGRHDAVDYAAILKDLSDQHFPGVAKIVLVQDNLTTHRPASL